MAQATAHLLAKDLVLTKEQLMIEEYPFSYPSLPGLFLRYSFTMRLKFCNWTKDEYEELSSSSKMFAMKCKTVEHTNQQESEVFSICIVNEDLQVMYKKLIKPDYQVEDYLFTKIGVNPESLKNTTTTLDDVQKFIREQLPNDAILVGHSLNFDLFALKLMHPYIIDTSVLYNTSGDILHKAKFKDLALKYLNTALNFSNDGCFNAERDALVAMKLVKLRIEKGPLQGLAYNSCPERSRRPLRIDTSSLRGLFKSKYLLNE